MNWPAPALLDMDRFVDGHRAAASCRSAPTRSRRCWSRREAVERHGPPRKGFWIWADDIDFTQRILRHEAGYLVPQSVAVHKTKTAHKP